MAKACVSWSNAAQRKKNDGAGFFFATDGTFVLNASFCADDGLSPTPPLVRRFLLQAGRKAGFFFVDVLKR